MVYLPSDKMTTKACSIGSIVLVAGLNRRDCFISTRKNTCLRFFPVDRVDD